MSLSTAFKDGAFPVLIHLHYEADEGGKWEKQIKIEQTKAPNKLRNEIEGVKSFSLAPNELIYGLDLDTDRYNGNVSNIKIKTVVI